MILLIIIINLSYLTKLQIIYHSNQSFIILIKLQKLVILTQKQVIKTF